MQKILQRSPEGYDELQFLDGALVWPPETESLCTILKSSPTTKSCPQQPRLEKFIQPEIHLGYSLLRPMMLLVNAACATSEEKI